MNAGFEDCVILDELLTKHGDNVMAAFEEMSRTRQPSTDALSALSLQNFVEMRSLTAKRWFVYKKRVEGILHAVAPQYWRPIYSMVTFSRTPYDEAMEIARRQDRVLTAVAGVACVTAVVAAGVAVKKLVEVSRSEGGLSSVVDSIKKYF